MPAIANSLVKRQHLTAHVAWRVAFVIPFILITVTAVVMILTCPDTPTGPWSSRARDVQRHLDMRESFFSTAREQGNGNAQSIDSGGLSNDTVKLNSRKNQGPCSEAQAEDDLLTAASWELVDKPTVQGSAKAVSSLPTFTLAVAYFCTFGLELSVNSILGAYYAKNFPELRESGSGAWVSTRCAHIYLLLRERLCL